MVLLSRKGRHLPTPTRASLRGNVREAIAWRQRAVRQHVGEQISARRFLRADFYSQKMKRFLGFHSWLLICSSSHLGYSNYLFAPKVAYFGSVFLKQPKNRFIFVEKKSARRNLLAENLLAEMRQMASLTLPRS
jgi:hypothetical protein